MHFPDNSNYSYSIGDLFFENVKNIGWLSKEYQFNIGISSIAFQKKLIDIIFLKDCNRMRGIHYCDICNPNYNLYLHRLGHIYKSKNLPVLSEETKLLGHSEIWIPSIQGNFMYASPTLIYHYVLEHHYLPPQEYIESVLAFDLNIDWDGDEIIENSRKLL